jgi:hypothetical protein
MTNATMAGLKSGTLDPKTGLLTEALDDSTLDANNNIVLGSVVKKRNLVVDQVFQTWYMFFAGGLGTSGIEVDKSWPEPPLSIGGTGLSAIIQAITGGLGKSGGSTAPSAASIPNPGGLVGTLAQAAATALPAITGRG